MLSLHLLVHHEANKGPLMCRVSTSQKAGLILLLVASFHSANCASLERNTSDVSFLTIPKVQQYQIKKEYSECLALSMADPTMIVTCIVLCFFLLQFFVCNIK